MKILLTGAAGFIGMHVAQLLLARGDEVLGLDNLNDYYDPALKQARLAQLLQLSGFRFVQADVADHAALDALFAVEQFTHVVHLAAQAGVRCAWTDKKARRSGLFFWRVFLLVQAVSVVSAECVADAEDTPGAGRAH